MKNFVSIEWLLENLSNDELVILDARAELMDPDYGLNEYKKGHIRGARFVSLEDTLTGKIDIHGGRHPLPDMNTFIEDMKKLGVEDNSTVVIYDNGDLAMAGRLWWLFKYAGKEKVFILAGGYKEWINNQLEVTSEIYRVEKSDSLSLNIDNSIIVEMKYVKEATNLDEIAIIDSRAYERYIGEVEPLDKIAGHIPNALNFPWMNLLEDGNIMPIEKIREHYKDLSKFKEIIVHCGSGITGTVNFIFMDEVDLKPKLYAGGYSDWISYEDNEVITG